MKHIHWWRWLLATFLILVAWVYTAALIALAAQAVLPQESPWQRLFHDLISFLPLFVATPVVWRVMTGRPIRELINTSGRVDVSRIGFGFLVWLTLSATTTVVDWLAHRDDYRFTFSWSVFLPFALVALALLPVQTWAEELFFRGWILRWCAPLPALAQVLISGTVFALPHLGNPEAVGQVAPALAAWFLLGAGWAYVSVRDGGIELAMGAHLANNLFSLLIVGYDDAALPTSAVASTGALNMVGTLIALAMVVPAFIFVTRPSRPRTS